jgi:indolepyruvate ferredoxin oxidoreductase
LRRCAAILVWSGWTCRAFGQRRSLSALAAERAARRLRGTPLDVFGYAHVRRVEQALVTEYRDAVRSALDHLDADAGTDEVVAIAELAEVVRGYEDIKLARVGQVRAQIEAALADLTGRRQVGAADPS